jgi:hypothetical protein
MLEKPVVLVWGSHPLLAFGSTMRLLGQLVHSLAQLFYVLSGELERRIQPFKGVFARTSTFSTCGGTANNSLVRANALAAPPVGAHCDLLFAKVSRC